MKTKVRNGEYDGDEVKMMMMMIMMMMMMMMMLMMMMMMMILSADERNRKFLKGIVQN